jgi:hypothetical protein
MPIRTVKQHSDRGSIKNLVAKSNEAAEAEYQPSPSELRMKKLFEYSQKNKDAGLQSALGFITTDYISDKTALPLSVYRIRKLVDDIRSRPDSKVSQLKQQFDQFFGDGLSAYAKEYLNRKMIKRASSKRKPLFWRVSE